MSLFALSRELYVFAQGARIWRYISGPKDLAYQTEQYTAASIERTKIAQTAEPTKLELTVPNDLDLLDALRPLPPMRRTTLKIFDWRKGSTTAALIWSGTIAEAEEGEDTTTLHCADLFDALGANGLTRNWQVQCPLALYGTGARQCNAAIADFAVAATLSATTSTTLVSATFAAKGDGWFAGGFVTWTDANNLTERRFVTAHAGATLTLLTPLPATAPTAVTAYPGCAHNPTVCNDKFGNILNYGGDPYIPQKNPFGSESIF